MKSAKSLAKLPDVRSGSAPTFSKSCTPRVMMYSLGAKRRFPGSARTPSRASRRKRVSTSCGTIEPPNTRANALSTVASSLRSIRATSPRRLLMPYRLPALALVYRWRAANGSPRVLSPQHGIGIPRRCGTTRILTAASPQLRAHLVAATPGGRRLPGPPRRLGDAAIRVVWSIGCFSRASGGMADALASGASVLRDVGVQVPLRPLFHQLHLRVCRWRTFAWDSGSEAMVDDKTAHLQ